MIEVQSLFFSYRNGTELFGGLNWAIPPGERIGIFGVSGMGKTTLAKLLGGYLRPQSGAILLDGCPVDALPGYHPVQVVGQNPYAVFHPLRTIRESISDLGISEAECSTRMGYLALSTNLLDRLPHELSGGELQRLALLRFLQDRHPFRYLVCDEITSMLDTLTQALVWKAIMAEVEKKGLGLIVISHDRLLLQRLTARIYRLDKPGGLVQISG